MPGERGSWVSFLAWPFPSTVYVTLGKLLKLFVPQFPNLYKETAILLAELLGELGIIQVKCLECRCEIAGNYL